MFLGAIDRARYLLEGVCFSPGEAALRLISDWWPELGFPRAPPAPRLYWDSLEGRAVGWRIDGWINVLMIWQLPPRSHLPACRAATLEADLRIAFPEEQSWDEIIIRKRSCGGRREQQHMKGEEPEKQPKRRHAMPSFHPPSELAELSKVNIKQETRNHDTHRILIDQGFCSKASRRSASIAPQLATWGTF